MSFDISHNYEFYCYLKANLPEGYKIVSEPSKNYYSEWYFNYTIFHSNEIIDVFKGNFKEIEQGELVQKANQIIKKIKKDQNDNRK